MSGLDGVQHGVLVHLVGTGFDHHDLVHGGGNGQGQIAHLALFLCGVQHDLAVHQTHLHAADGAVPRDVGHGSDQRGTDHTGDLGAAVRVKAHHGHGDAHVVAHFLGEQRAHGAVHHAAGQDGALAGAALAAHKAAGDAACGVELFLILHVQGEEIHALAGLGAHDHVAHDAGLAVADQCTGVGQAAHLAHFYLERAAGQHGFVDLEVFKGLFAGTKFNCHCFCLLVFADLLFSKGCGTRIIAINPASLPAGTGARFTAATRCRRHLYRKYKKQKAGTFAVPALCLNYLRRPRVAIRAR